MKIYLSFLFLFCFNTLLYGQVQRNYAQELFNLMMNGRNFEAREFKLQHRDQLQQHEKVVELVYNMHMSLAFNKPDSAVVYFEEFLGNPYHVHGIGPVVSHYYIRLCELYEDKQQFDKAIATVERHINYLKENPYSLAPDIIKKEIKEAQDKISSLKEKLDHEPIRRIVRDGKDNQIKLKDDPHIRFDGLYNGHIVETFFDTGLTAFCSMEKDLADQIGVKYKPKQDSIRLINGKPIKAIEGYIGQIDLKGIKLYNIPVLILMDRFTSHLPKHSNPDYKQQVADNLLKSKQVLFGLPAIKMIGGLFEFDWKSNMLIIHEAKNQKPIANTLKPNIVFFNNAAYLNLKIHETNFTGFLDLGSDHYLFLTYPYFFKSNSAYVKNDFHKQPYTRTGFLGVQENIERYRVKNPEIYLNRKKITINQPQREVFTVANMNNFDGEVGVGFFKNTFSKTFIDFNNMTIECED